MHNLPALTTEKTTGGQASARQRRITIAAGRVDNNLTPEGHWASNGGGGGSNIAVPGSNV